MIVFTCFFSFISSGPPETPHLEKKYKPLNTPSNSAKEIKVKIIPAQRKFKQEDIVDIESVAAVVFTALLWPHCSDGVHRVPRRPEFCPSARDQDQEEEIWF